MRVVSVAGQSTMAVHARLERIKNRPRVYVTASRNRTVFMKSSTGEQQTARPLRRTVNPAKGFRWENVFLSTYKASAPLRWFLWRWMNWQWIYYPCSYLFIGLFRPTLKLSLILIQRRIRLARFYCGSSMQIKNYSDRLISVENPLSSSYQSRLMYKHPVLRISSPAQMPPLKDFLTLSI